MLKRLAVLLVTALLSTGVSLAGSGVASASTAGTRAATFNAHLLSFVNRAREQHGLRPLRLARGTSTVASRWAGHLAGIDALAHNPDLAIQVERHGSRNWTALGENVAAGTTAHAVFTSYMHSPEHRANILDRRYRYIGVGVAFGHGFSFNVLDFVDRYSG